MTTAAGSSAQIEAYLAAVREALSDIPEDERADLLAEVEASLVEAAGEGDRPITSLGPPEEFAAELRASAGLGEAARVAAPNGFTAMRAFALALARRPAARSALRTARELAPAWWLVRGYLVVAAIAAVTGANWSLEHPWLPLLPGARASALLIVAAVIGSLALGLRTRGGQFGVAAAVLALNVVAILAIVPVERHVRRVPATTVVSFSNPPPANLPGLVDSGRRITNLYPFSRTGTLLHDVLLYDQDGRAVTLALGPDQLRRIPRTARGGLVQNAYPIRYYQPGTRPRRVAHPDARPSISTPRLVTPPLTP